jgi:hypothetical protein
MPPGTYTKGVGAGAAGAGAEAAGAEAALETLAVSLDPRFDVTATGSLAGREGVEAEPALAGFKRSGVANLSTDAFVAVAFER